MRLTIIFIVTNGGIHEAEMKKILSVANFPPELVNCFKNLPRIGVNMGKPPEKPKKKKSQAPPDAQYDVSRFNYPLQRILTVRFSVLILCRIYAVESVVKTIFYRLLVLVFQFNRRKELEFH